MRDYCINNWQEFKARVFVKKGLNAQYIERAGCYDIFAMEGAVLWSTTVMFGGADCADFEANYKALCNYAAGAINAPFASDDYVAADGICLPIEVTGETANLDVPITADNLYTDGGRLVVINAKIGDWIEVQVVNADTEGVNPYLEGVPLGYVLKAWGADLVDPNHPNAILKPYAGHPPIGTAMRVVYHKAARAQGEPNPTAGVKINLHAQEI